jgi:hypothetical protein
MKLPVYELSLALEGRLDEFGDPLPNVTHVTFKRDYLTADDFVTILETVGDMADLGENQAKQFKLARVLLPRMTDLSDADAGLIKVSDFVALVAILGPFLEF